MPPADSNEEGLRGDWFFPQAAVAHSATSEATTTNVLDTMTGSFLRHASVRGIAGFAAIHQATCAFTPMGGKPRQNRSRLVAAGILRPEVSDNTGQVSRLLREWIQGDKRAHDELVPIVYATLRRLAEHYLADERHAQTLQPTALVHEAYVRLVEQGTPEWGGKAHFYGVAAHLMRQVLVDHARRRLSLKRGAGAIAVELEAALDVAASTPPMEIIALNEALEELAAVDQRKCRVVEMRYFGGLTEEETAATLGLSVATVRRDLRAAEAWLGDRLRSGR